MKIALVHEMMLKLGGAERVVKKLLDMYPNSPIYTLLKNENAMQEWFKGANIQASLLQKWFEKTGSHKWMLGKMPKAIESFDFSGFDVVISSNSAFAHGIKVPQNTKHICYCHSPMRYAWDYAHQYTQKMSPVMRLAAAQLLNEIRVWDFETSKNPHKIIANSKHVKNRIEKYYRRKAHVIYPPVQVSKFEAREDHEDYFLIVSTLAAYKRIDIAIEAFNKLGRRLIVIGDGAQRKLLESMAKDNIEFLGRKEDAVVQEYIQNCRAFIFPGEEDFGISPVEAMAAGKPVLAYGVGGVLESVIEGKTGEFFHHPTPDSLIKGLTRLMMNEKNYDYKKIRAHAEKFDEAVFEEKIKKLVQKI